MCTCTALGSRKRRNNEGRDEITLEGDKSFSIEQEGRIRFIPLSLTSAKIVLWTDAAFANAHGSNAQIGFEIAMVDAHNQPRHFALWFVQVQACCALRTSS